jgi:hypothetical protein
MFSLPHDTNLSISTGEYFNYIMLNSLIYFANNSGFFLLSISTMFQIIIRSLFSSSVPTVAKSLESCDKDTHFKLV